MVWDIPAKEEPGGQEDSEVEAEIAAADQADSNSDDESEDEKQSDTINAVLSLSGHQREVTSVAFSPTNGRQILTSSRDGTAILWPADAWDGSEVAPSPDIEGAVARIVQR